MGVKLNTASGGSVSIEPTNTASNFTLTVPAQTGTVVASDSSGNVGIGTSSPRDVAGYVSLGLNDTTGGILDFSASGTRVMSLTGNSSNCTLSTITNTPFTIGINTNDAFQIDTSRNLKFDSGYGSVAIAYGCRAWVALNASSGSPSIDASGNISSITDNGAGDFTLNFATSMPDANYSPVGMSASNTGTTSGGLVLCVRTTSATGAPTTKTTSALRVLFAGTGNGVDAATINVAIFR